jgi:hypothetical protein
VRDREEGHGQGLEGDIVRVRRVVGMRRKCVKGGARGVRYTNIGEGVISL